MTPADRFIAKRLLADAVDRACESAVFIPLIYPKYAFAVSRPIVRIARGPRR
jgi:hypothetical protein